MASKVTELQQEITSLKQKHEVEIWELQEKMKKSHDDNLIQKEVMQKQEVSALTQEWNRERQVGTELKWGQILWEYFYNTFTQEGTKINVQ